MAAKIKQENESIKVAYKIRMVIDIEGELEDERTLRDDTGIEPVIQWAADDIEEKLGCVCDIVGVKKVELEQLN